MCPAGHIALLRLKLNLDHILPVAEWLSKYLLYHCLPGIYEFSFRVEQFHLVEQTEVVLIDLSNMKYP